MLNNTLIENYLDYFPENLGISPEPACMIILYCICAQNLSHKTYRLVVGIHSLYLALRDGPESIEDASRKHSGVLCCFCLLHINLFSSTEMCGSLFQNNENESSLAYTDIFVSFP